MELTVNDDIRQSLIGSLIDSTSEWTIALYNLDSAPSIDEDIEIPDPEHIVAQYSVPATRAAVMYAVRDSDNDYLNPDNNTRVEVDGKRYYISTSLGSGDYKYNSIYVTMSVYNSGSNDIDYNLVTLIADTDINNPGTPKEIIISAGRGSSTRINSRSRKDFTFIVPISGGS